MKSKNLLRIRILAAGILLIALILVIKLYFLQVVSGDDFRLKAEHQYVSPNQTIFNRGSIFFANKDGQEIAGATLQTGFTLSVNPKMLANPETAYEKLNKIAPIEKETFIAKTSRKNDPYEEIAKRINDENAKKIEALKISGVSLYKDRWRLYPAHDLAANVIGFIGYKGNDLAGRYGLESYYEDVLKRSDNELYANFFAQIFGDIQNTLQKNSSLGGDIVTAIEPTVEGFLEKELASVEDTWRSESSGGIIMDPKTGEIYGMAVHPSFDPNSFQTEKNQAVFSNPIVENVYEMGSIIKPLTVATGIDTGVITPESTYYDNGYLVLNNARISNFDGKGRGKVTMQTVLNESLNTGAAYIAGKVGNNIFSNYFKSFGLGDETGIDLPNETHGLINNLDSPRDIEHATASFGQGIATSPIATTRALAALANNGILPNPHVVKKIEYKIGVTKSISADEGKRVLKPETTEAVTKMLVKVVDDALLGGTVKLKNYSVAAKTGTAQIAKERGGGYYDDRYLHSFFGYFPAYNPKFIVFLYTVYPKKVNYASHTLTGPFMDIAKFLIHYYSIPPDR